MPRLIRVYITNVAIGFALAALFVGLLLWFDIARLGHLVSTSDKGWLAILVLWLANGVVFAGVQFAIFIMLNNDDDDDHPRGGRRDPMKHRPLTPIRVRATAPSNKANSFETPRH